MGIRTDRSRFPDGFELGGGSIPEPRPFLLALDPPTRAEDAPVERWPEWLVPSFRSGGHRVTLRLFQDLREER